MKLRRYAVTISYMYIRIRKLDFSGADDPEQDLIDTYEALQRGHFSEAKSILERLIFPKWRTKQQCELAYAKARAIPSGEGRDG